jgi:hypothetical protein
VECQGWTSHQQARADLVGSRADPDSRPELISVVASRLGMRRLPTRNFADISCGSLLPSVVVSHNESALESKVDGGSHRNAESW